MRSPHHSGPCGDGCIACERIAEFRADDRASARRDFMTDREMDGRAADMVFGRWDS